MAEILRIRGKRRPGSRRRRNAREWKNNEAAAIPAAPSPAPAPAPAPVQEPVRVSRKGRPRNPTQPVGTMTGEHIAVAAYADRRWPTREGTVGPEKTRAAGLDLLGTRLGIADPAPALSERPLRRL